MSDAVTKKIVGGLDVSPKTVIVGGNPIVVGENAKWNMRNKFIQLKHASTIKDERKCMKTLLKILNISIPLTFNTNVYYDDEDKMPTITKKTKAEGVHEKAIDTLDSRLKESARAAVQRLIEENNLRAPLYWTLGDVVKFLAVQNKKKKPNARKVKISPNMAVLIENIWHGKSYFKYKVNSEDIPNNMLKLMLHMLEVVEKNRVPQGMWKEPMLKKTEYPTLSAETVEKYQLHKSADAKGKVKSVKDRVKTALLMENELINHVEEIELYYADMAENIKRILTAMKKFFKGANNVVKK